MGLNDFRGRIRNPSIRAYLDMAVQNFCWDIGMCRRDATKLRAKCLEEGVSTRSRLLATFVEVFLLQEFVTPVAPWSCVWMGGTQGLHGPASRENWLHHRLPTPVAVSRWNWFLRRIVQMVHTIAVGFSRAGCEWLYVPRLVSPQSFGRVCTGRLLVIHSNVTLCSGTSFGT